MEIVAYGVQQKQNTPTITITLEFKFKSQSLEYKDNLTIEAFAPPYHLYNLPLALHGTPADIRRFYRMNILKYQS